MPKNLPDDGPLNEKPLRSVRPPPPLSEDLIAKLQMAVNDARQKRTLQPSTPEYPEQPPPKS